MRESWASSAATRASMLGNRNRDTKPELALRRALHARGLRYRVCFRPLAGERQRADVVFTRAKVAVELLGCFWHGCPEHYRPPRGNRDYWLAKIERNIRRDQDNAARLCAAGWTVVQIWEHESADDAVARVLDALEARRAG